MNFIITIDGPAGAGKSSVAKRLAKRLGVRYLDTGAIYRAVAYAMEKKGVSLSEESRIEETLSQLRLRLGKDGIFVDDEDVTTAIRTPQVDKIVSAWSALKVVRDSLLHLQRDQTQYGSLIVDGRDTGTVVFPHADLKFFLTASPEARAERRYKELLKKGEAVGYKEVLSRMYERDRADSSREVAPLKEPEGAIRVDTSAMSEEEVVNQLAFLIQRRIGLALDIS